MLIKFLPDVQKDLVRYLCHHVHPYFYHYNKNGIDAHSNYRQLCQPLHVLVCNGTVDCFFNNQGVYKGNGDGKQHTGHNAGHLEPILEHVGEQALQRFFFPNAV